MKDGLPIVYLCDDRRTVISPWGKGNPKLGPNVFTYSTLPGLPENGGTCPGLSDECWSVCFARRVEHNDLVWSSWTRNTNATELPPLPPEAKLVRIHVSGDFNTTKYVEDWIELTKNNPGVTFWGYTRSWRIPRLLPYLDILRSLPNVSLWASIDGSIDELPPTPWRRAWFETDTRVSRISAKKFVTFDGRIAIVCPEENGLLPNCEVCRFCWKDAMTDLVFLIH